MCAARKSTNKAAKSGSATSGTLSPLLSTTPRKEVDWLFVFKFNSNEEEGRPMKVGATGLFDVKGIPKPPYDLSAAKFSLQYAYASSADSTLQMGQGDDLVGASLDDPLGATFGQVYLAEDPPYFVIWNDDFYGDPIGKGGSPWGHSKGMLVWNDAGEGFILQVSTPSWPGAASNKFPRLTDGNTLGFVHDDDVEASQHFFALKLNKDDVMNVLAALHNSSVRTDPTNAQAVHNGGPPAIQTLVKYLGTKSKDTTTLNLKLSSGVTLISKASALHVPPWQLVSSELDGVDLRVACWWANPLIPSTTSKNPTPACWGTPPLAKKPGVVDIATSGTWPPSVTTPNLDLRGGRTQNHAKFGVSTTANSPLTIFGDMNQQGTLGGGAKPCTSSQNGRGGMFFVVDDPGLHASVTALLTGASGPTDLAAAQASTRLAVVAGKTPGTTPAVQSGKQAASKDSTPKTAKSKSAQSKTVVSKRPAPKKATPKKAKRK